MATQPQTSPRHAATVGSARLPHQACPIPHASIPPAFSLPHPAVTGLGPAAAAAAYNPGWPGGLAGVSPSSALSSTPIEVG